MNAVEAFEIYKVFKNTKNKLLQFQFNTLYDSVKRIFNKGSLH